MGERCARRAGLSAAAALWAGAAGAMPIDAWIEAAQVCETVLLEQDDRVLRGLPEVGPLVDVTLLLETSVALGALHVAALQVLDGDWVLRVVEDRSDAPEDTAGLARSWPQAAAAAFPSPAYAEATIRMQTPSGARVLCLPGGGLVSIMGFIIPETGRFRVAASNMVPGRAASPYEGAPVG